MARISEMHYSNALASSTGIPEFLEIALSVAEELVEGDFTASFYNSNGALIDEFVLTDVRFVEGDNKIFDSGSNEWNYVIASNVFGTFLTDPDGGGATNAEAYALTDTSTSPNTVIDFYDIGSGTANITAIGGAAAGAVSENVPVPTSGNPNAAQGSIQYNQPNPGTATNETITEGTSGDVVCFAAGTPITTVTGSVPVEKLRVGDLVLTRDNGPRPVRWTGWSRQDGRGHLALIRFEAGVIGNHQPLYLSPQHRVLVSSLSAAISFDGAEVLAAATDLVGQPGIARAPRILVCYHHFIFDQHEIVMSAGAWTESFLPGPFGLSTLDCAQLAELLLLFPQLRREIAEYCIAARRILAGQEARALRYSA